ncbi:MAG: aminotransferase class I/II-fold pyridoxal phosphate-dependent enzyme [Pseudomonadota bacterium]
MTHLSQRARSAAAELSVIFDFFSRYRDTADGTDVVADFTFGNPHEMALPGLVEVLKRRAEPATTDYFAYKTSEEEPRATVAAALSEELGLAFAPQDIQLTQGAFGAIALAFSMLCDPGDECIIPVPGWFCYATVLAARNAVPVKVPLEEGTFDLDIGTIEAAITPRTRVVVVNSPHNPTGIVYTREKLKALAAMLDRKSVEIGHRIYILSDEPYRRIRFDGVPFVSPAEVYPWTLIDYSYAKIMLAPGLRIGYLAICPEMPRQEREDLRALSITSQIADGWAFPDAPLQYGIGDLEKVSIDLGALKAKRDRMHGALSQWGYNMTKPAGTFYLWGAAPGGDAETFARNLGKRGVFVMPGTLFERPADFRICLTATPEMIEDALPYFQDAAAAA